MKYTAILRFYNPGIMGNIINRFQGIKPEDFADEVIIFERGKKILKEF